MKIPFLKVPFLNASDINLANSLTLLRLFASPLFFIIRSNTYLTMLTLVCALSDFFDGFAARKLGQVTPLGTALDPIADKICTHSIIFALFKKGHLSDTMFYCWMALIIKDICLIVGFFTLSRHANFKVEPLMASKISTALLFLSAVLFLSGKIWGSESGGAYLFYLTLPLASVSFVQYTLSALKYIVKGI